MESSTRRYRADSSASYVLALIQLMEYARSHRGEEFEFGPMDVESMTAGGLAVSGPDLAGPAALLAQVPGLVEEPEPETAPARLAQRVGLGVPGGPGGR